MPNETRFESQDADRRQARRRRGRRRSPTSTRPPRRCSARSPTRRRRTCTGRSTRRGAPSTRPTGRRTTPSASSCLDAAAGGARGRAGGAARGAHPRGRLPADVTHGPQLDAPLADALRYPAQLIDEYPWETDRSATPWYRLTGHQHHPQGLAGSRSASSARSCRGTSRSRSPSTSSARRSPPATPSCSSRRPTRRSTPRASAGSIAEHTDIPRGRGQRRHRVGPPRRRGAHALAEGRPHLLHRLDRGRQADHGEGRGDDEAPLPRARRQVGHDRARRRRPRRRLHDGHRARACTPARAAPSRPACCCRGRATTRASRSSRASTRASRRAIRRTRHALRPGDLGQAARPRPSATSSKGIDEGANAARRRRRRARRARQGLLRQAHAVRRRRQLDDHRPGGDLRPGAGRHPVRRRRRRRPHRQRQPLRPGRQRACRARSSARWPSPAASAPASSASTAAPPTAPTCPSAATRRAASAARTASPVRPVPRDQVRRLPGPSVRLREQPECSFRRPRGLRGFDDAVAGDVRDPYTELAR